MLKFKISKLLLQDIVKKAVQLSSNNGLFTMFSMNLEDNDCLVCNGLNQEATQSIYAKTKCDIDSHGYVYVDGTKLYNLINNMNGEIEFSESESRLTIKCNNSNYRLHKDTLESMPPLNKFNKLSRLIGDNINTSSKFKCSNLFDPINSIKYVMRKGHKEFCNSILMQSNLDLSLITTDEHTICIKLLAEEVNINEDQWIDKDNLNYILKTFDRDDKISLLFTEEKILAYNNNILFSFNRVQYKWPNLDFIDKFVYSNTIIVNMEEFRSSIERICSVIETDNKNEYSIDTLQICLSDNTMTMTITDKCEEKIALEMNHSIDSIGMDPIKIRAMLKNIKTKELKIHFSNAKVPILFEENENSKYYICQKRI